MSLSETLATKFDFSSVNAIAVDIITFAESKEYLGIKLFPVQRFILKLIYNLPLDLNLIEPIVIKDKFNIKIERTFTSELEFKEFLYKTGRLNSILHEFPLTEIYMIIGRRGTKNSLTSIITNYTLYLVLLNYDPQKYFNILEDSEIAFMICSNSKANASRQYREISRMVYRCPFFKPFLLVEELNKISSLEFKLGTRKHMKEGTGGLIVVTVNAVSPSLRGGSNCIVVGDEYAHYLDSEKSTKDKPLDELMYEASVPSLSGFKNPDGTAFGKAFFITSPNGKKGATFKAYDSSRDNPNIFVINLPTVWVNPQVDSTFLKNTYNKSELSFQQEFGAEFITSSTSSWVKRIEFFFNSTCDNLKANTINGGEIGVKYYASCDLALSGDGAVITVCHESPTYVRNNKVKDALISDTNVIVFDHIWYSYPVNNTPTRVSEIIERMIEVVSYYKVEHFDLDQWSIEMFKQYLEDFSLSNPSYAKLRKILRVVNASQISNSDFARNFRTLLVEGRLAYPNNDEILEQLTGLKESVSSHFIKVENKTGRDDIPNSMFKCAFSCINDKNRVNLTSHLRTPRESLMAKEYKMRSLNNRQRKSGGMR